MNSIYKIETNHRSKHIDLDKIISISDIGEYHGVDKWACAPEYPYVFDINCQLQDISIPIIHVVNNDKMIHMDVKNKWRNDKQKYTYLHPKTENFKKYVLSYKLCLLKDYQDFQIIHYKLLRAWDQWKRRQRTTKYPNDRWMSVDKWMEISEATALNRTRKCE